MPSKNVAINLIGEEEMGHTPVGRIISWAVTYGRYIMIGTEVVVLLAFISRFSLDRKLTDLNDEIAQKQAIIEANVDFEKEFRRVQNQITTIRELVSAPTPMTGALDTVQSLLPPDVRLDSLDIAPDKLTANAVAGTAGGFSTLLSNLQTARSFKNVDIGDIKRDPLTGIHFQFTAALAGVVTPTPTPKIK
jgi:Tfp pilus assembly protein PilN